MPENIVVTLRTEKQGGGLWPFVRGLFAWVGFVAVVAGVWFLKPPDVQHAIDAVRAGYQAYRTFNENRFAGIAFDPSPEPESRRVCNPYDDHHNPGACALMSGDPPQ